MNSLRTLLIYASMLCINILILTSCQKEVVNVAPVLPYDIPDKEFYATVDGVEFVDTILWGQEDLSANTITITATVDGDYPKMILIMPSDISLGTFNFGGEQSDYKGILNFGVLPFEKFSAFPNSGTLIITEHDTDADYIKGTFSYLAVPSTGNTSTTEFIVSNGEFTVSY